LTISCHLFSAEDSQLRFLPYSESVSVPNIIVDGAANARSVLTLSHWPKSGTRREWKRDTSAEIVFAYLDSPQHHVPVDVVSNNHLDEDGLVGVFALTDPATAESRRDLLIDIARAGDFGVFASRDAARIAFTISAHADPQTSPLPGTIFKQRYPEMAAELYVRLLNILPRVLANVNDYRSLWENEDAKLTASEERIEAGRIWIKEEPELDLAVIRVPGDLDVGAVHRFTQRRLAECHPMAIHNRTNCNRIVLVQGNRIEMQYRYESWVQFISRKPLARVDLSPLANELNQQETTRSRWVFDGVDQITPKLHLEGEAESSIPVEAILNRLRQCLRDGPPAWDPSDDGA
jgi:hypothetical protein